MLVSCQNGAEAERVGAARSASGHPAPVAPEAADLQEPGVFPSDPGETTQDKPATAEHDVPVSLNTEPVKVVPVREDPVPMSAHPASVDEPTAVSADPYGRSRRNGTLALGLFAVAVLEVTIAIVGSVAVGFDLGDAVESFVVTNGLMGLAFPVSGVLTPRTGRETRSAGCCWPLVIGHVTTAALAPVL